MKLANIFYLSQVCKRKNIIHTDTGDVLHKFTYKYHAANTIGKPQKYKCKVLFMKTQFKITIKLDTTTKTFWIKHDEPITNAIHNKITNHLARKQINPIYTINTGKSKVIVS